MKIFIARICRTARQYPAESVILILLLLIYVFLFGRYSINDIDDTWTTAWSYYFMHDGTVKDLLFEDGNPYYWGIRFTSRVFCWLSGIFLSIAGWTKNNIHLFSHLCGAGTLFLTYLYLEKYFPQKRQRIWCLLLLAMSTVFFAAANKGRSDMFILFFMTASVLTFNRGKSFLTGLCVCICMETHPIGVLVSAYLLASVLTDRSLFNKKQILLLFAGGLAGTLVYFLIYGIHFSELTEMLQYATGAKDNFLYMHFAGRKSFPQRFLPELILFSVSGFIVAADCIRRKKLSFPLTASILLVGESFIVRRGNFHYALFCYPAFIFLMTEACAVLENRYPRFRKIPWCLIGFFLLMFPQYLYLYWKNGRVSDEQYYLKRLADSHISTQTPVFGEPADWFAFQPNRNFRVKSGFRDPQRDFYLIEHHDTRYMASEHFVVNMSELKPKYHICAIHEFDLPSGGKVRVLRCTLKQNKP